MRGKPVALVGAASGMSGTIRAQAHMRQILVFSDSPCMNQPEVLIPRAQDRFDASGRLTDESTRALLTQFGSAFVAFVARDEDGSLLVEVHGGVANPFVGHVRGRAPFRIEDGRIADGGAPRDSENALPRAELGQWASPRRGGIRVDRAPGHVERGRLANAVAVDHEWRRDA